MDLYLRKVMHPQAHDNYRVILKREDGAFEIGSIGIQHGGIWAWGIDTVIPVRSFETEGGAATGRIASGNSKRPGSDSPPTRPT